MRNRKLRSDNFTKFAPYILLFLILLGYALYRQEYADPEVFNVGSVNLPKVLDKKNVAPTKKKPHSVPEKSIEKNLSPTEIYKESIGFNSKRYDYFVKQKIIQREFKKTIKLDMDFPNNMDFTPINMENNIAGIYGTTPDKTKQFAVLATKGKVDVKEVLNYLHESANALPLLKNHEFQPDKIQTIKAPDSTGLGDLQVIPSTDASGKTTYAAIATRKDGEGSYLFLMQAPHAYYENNDDGLGIMLNSVKTKP